MEIHKMKLADKNTELHEIYAQFQSELCRYVVAKVGCSSAEAEDVVQTAFTKIAETGLGAVKNHRAFLYKSCYHIAIDRVRHSKICQRYAEDIVKLNDDLVEELGPERHVESREKMNLIKKAMQRMTSKRRRIIIMSRVDGMSNAEIARQLGLSETGVRRHILKALAGCHDALNADNG